MQKAFAMADIDVKLASWKLVEIGRVVLIRRGPYDGKLAVVVEVVDHRRVREPNSFKTGLGMLERQGSSGRELTK